MSGRKSVPGGKDSMCKGPEIGRACLVSREQQGSQCGYRSGQESRKR